MIICMSDILCITNRKLCKEDFLERIEKISKEKTFGIILREKDLSEYEYAELAYDVREICQRYGVPCIFHSFVNVAKCLNCMAVHLPLQILRTLSVEDKKYFLMLGTSCHSVEEALEAERLGCTYIIAGHIFETDCKMGLEGRGISFLQEVCQSVEIPVYGIGGINAENIESVREAGAVGACVMSGIMTCDNPQKYLGKLEKKNEI